MIPNVELRGDERKVSHKLKKENAMYVPQADNTIKIDNRQIISQPEPPDYLSFVDADIAAIFEGKGGYFLNDILMAQIIKELRKLNGG
jgi:hypothetical protein